MLVEAAPAVAHPLPCDGDRAPDVEAEEVVLEGGGMALPHQEADQALVLAVHRLLHLQEGHAGSVHHRQVGRLRGVEPHETMVQDLDGVSDAGHAR